MDIGDINGGIWCHGDYICIMVYMEGYWIHINDTFCIILAPKPWNIHWFLMILGIEIPLKYGEKMYHFHQKWTIYILYSQNIDTADTPRYYYGALV